MAAKVLMHLSGLDGVGTGGKTAGELRAAFCGGGRGMVADLASALRVLEREGKVVRHGAGKDTTYAIAPRPRQQGRKRGMRRRPRG